MASSRPSSDQVARAGLSADAVARRRLSNGLSVLVLADDAVPMRRPFWKKRAGRCAAARAAADEFDGSTHRLTSAVWPPPMSNERRTAEFGDSTRDA